MIAKIGSCLASLLLAATLCLGPYAGAAYAWVQLAIPAGKALAAVLAVLGVSVAINTDDDAAALWSDFELYTDDLEAMGAQVSALQDAAIELGAANGQLVNATKSQVSAQEVDAIKDVFAAAGQAGTFVLDQLSILSADGVLGLLPFLLSGFIANQVSVPSDIIFTGLSYLDKSFTFPVQGNAQRGYPSRFGLTCLCSMVKDGIPIARFDRYSYTSTSLTLLPDGRCLVANTGSFRDLVLVNGRWDSTGAYPSDYSFVMHPGNPSQLVLSNLIDYTIYYNDAGNKEILGHLANGVLTLSHPNASVTDNPDVNLGHDYWTDAKDRVDLLNPATGAAVIGSDAVIDGDYIKSRGSMTIPTDWADINSWADALARTHAGVIEGALDGTISTTQTGTAVNVGTGELVTDTVGNLTRPGSNTSVALPMPGLFDGVVDAVSDKFPFCIPADLHKCLVALSAPPVAPAFDWTFALSQVGLQDVTIRIDLAPFDQVAMILRVCLSVSCSIGLIFLSIRLLNLWGGD